MDKLIAFVVICQLSLTLLTNDLFVEFIEVLFPNVHEYLPKACNIIRKWVMNSFKERRKKLKEELARTDHMVHFSFDLWTSPNHLALLGVVAYYADEFGQNQTVS
jgi:hypothetical protein